MNSDLMLLADGRFPAGGHSWSAGVEAAVNVGDVVDAATLERFLSGRLATTGRVDAAFASAACALVSNADSAELSGAFDLLDREYDARIPSPHLRATSRRLGRHFVRAALTIWPSVPVTEAGAAPGGPHQPIVLGAVVAVVGGGPREAAVIALYHTSAAVTTAGVRLLGLDPIAMAAVASRCIARSVPTIETVRTWASSAPAGLPAAGGSLTEILGERHGHLDARLFVA